MARASAMGNAFIGLSDDITALYFNPAGLAQMRQSEFSLGFMHLNTGNDTRYLSFPTLNSKDSKTGLSNIGLSVPFPVAQGSFVIGASYYRLSDFSSSSEFKGFNNLNSIQPTLYQSFVDDDLAWKSLPPVERQDLIEDLNEDGLSDWDNPGPQDLPLIISRLELIQELAPFAMDQVNADAFQEAHKDLWEMFDRITRH